MQKEKINVQLIEFLNDRWFQVFDYLYRNHAILTPTNSKRFQSFITKLEKKQPEVFNNLIQHLNKFNVENLLKNFG